MNNDNGIDDLKASVYFSMFITALLAGGVAVMYHIVMLP